MTAGRVRGRAFSETAPVSRPRDQRSAGPAETSAYIRKGTVAFHATPPRGHGARPTHWRSRRAHRLHPDIRATHLKAICALLAWRVRTPMVLLVATACIAVVLVNNAPELAFFSRARRAIRRRELAARCALLSR